jgi:hypothetical protein
MAARILEKKSVYSISVRPVRSKEGSRGVVVGARSKVRSRKKEQNISRLDIYVGGRPYKTFNAENGSVRARTLRLGSRRRKAELLVQAFDGKDNLVAAYRY